MKQRYVQLIVGIVLVTLGASSMGFTLGRSTAPLGAPVFNDGPLTVRAEADARAWLRSHVSSVARLRRNAVVFNWTVVPGGSTPRPGWQFSEWYLRAPDGTLRIAGVQRLSGLGG